MKIKIKSKKALPSNKAKTPGIPTPFIDKISVTLSIHDDALAQVAHKEIFNSIDDKDVYLDAKGKFNGFNFAKRLNLGSGYPDKHYPLFQFRSVSKAVTGMRIEFVPVDVGADGMLRIHSILQGILPNGWGDFAKNGKVTRIDIAVDFGNKHHSDFLFLPKQSSTRSVWASNGTLETFSYGKPQGNQTLLYDRKAKRIAHKSPWQGKEGIRLERRLRNQSFSPSALVELSNPFLGITLVRPISSYSSPGGAAHVWKLFCLAVEARGLEGALAALPEDLRTKYRSHFKAHPVDWWAPDEIWNGWQPMLDELQISKTKW